MEKTKAISPDEVIKQLPDYFPNSVIEAVNGLLLDNYRGQSVNIKQNTIIARIMSIDKDIHRDDIFDKKYLDFESVFREQGWNVTYDKPGYNEDYEAYYTFSKRN